MKSESESGHLVLEQNCIYDPFKYLWWTYPFDFAEVLDISLFSYFSPGAGGMITCSFEDGEQVGAKPPSPPPHPL